MNVHALPLLLLLACPSKDDGPPADDTDVDDTDTDGSPSEATPADVQFAPDADGILGPTCVGNTATTRFTVANLGGTTWSGTATVDASAFGVSPEALTIPPESTATLDVSCAPLMAGEVTGTLTLASPDADGAQLALTCSSGSEELVEARYLVEALDSGQPSWSATAPAWIGDVDLDDVEVTVGEREGTAPLSETDGWWYAEISDVIRLSGSWRPVVDETVSLTASRPCDTE